MKKLLAIATALLVGGVFAPVAEARPQAVGNYSILTVGRHACGCAIQQRRYVVGYDHYRRPVYRFVSVPTVHRCRNSSHRHYDHNRYNSRYDNRGHYGHRGYYSQPRVQFRSSYYSSGRPYYGGGYGRTCR